MLSGMFMMVLETLAGLITMLLLVRTAMRWMRISFINQLGQFILATTNWIVLPAQKILPSVGKLDLSALVPAWVLQMLLVVLTVLLSGSGFGNPASALIGVMAIGALLLLRTTLYLLMGVVILSAVLSWVNPYAPIAPMVNALTRPFLEPIRRVVPPLGGVDLSPLVLLLVIQVLVFVLNTLHGNLIPLLYS